MRQTLTITVSVEVEAGVLPDSPGSMDPADPFDVEAPESGIERYGRIIAHDLLDATVLALSHSDSGLAPVRLGATAVASRPYDHDDTF